MLDKNKIFKKPSKRNQNIHLSKILIIKIDLLLLLLLQHRGAKIP
jgi:hypothetical protein